MSIILKMVGQQPNRSNSRYQITKRAKCKSTTKITKISNKGQGKNDQW